MSVQIIDSKVIASHNVYLTEKVEKLLQNKISWDSISGANIITSEQASLITKGEESKEYIDALMNVADNVSTVETLQHTLALIDNATTNDVSLLENFDEKNLNTLIKLLSKEDETIQLLLVVSFLLTSVMFTTLFQLTTLQSSNGPAIF